MKKPDTKLDVFEILQLLTDKGLVKDEKGGKSYCDCCGKTHFRSWYLNARTGDRFYICTVAGKIKINYRYDKSWNDIGYLDLINQLL